MSSQPVTGGHGPDAKSAEGKPSHTSSYNHLPFWTPGSRHYGKTLGQLNREAVNSSSNLLLAFIDEHTVKTDSVFTIADCGANDGSASMDLMTGIVGQIRKKHGDELPVQIIYEDQEKNDFNSLFATLADSNSPVSKFTNVYPLTTNVSFYKQCVPDDTCDVIFSSIAINNKESLEIPFKDAIYHESPRVSYEERQRFQLDAAQDWVKFLLLRAKELKPGGLLVVLSISRSDDYQLLSGGSIGDPDKAAVKRDCPVSRVGSCNRDTHLDLERAWRQLRDEGIIEQHEYEKCTMNTILRSGKDITAPFVEGNSSVSKAGLSLIYHDQFVPRHLIKYAWQDKLAKEGIDDRASFAQRLMECAQVFSYSSFEGSLSSSRSDQQKAAILDELYDRFRTLVPTKDPASYVCENIVSRLVVRKD